LKNGARAPVEGETETGILPTGLRETAAGDARIARQIVPPLEHETGVGRRRAGTRSTHAASVGKVTRRAELAVAVRRRLHARVARRTVFAEAVDRQQHGTGKIGAAKLRLYPLIRLVRLIKN